MEKIPTAEEILKPYLEMPFIDTEVVQKDNALLAMKEFAKLHVEAALKNVWNSSEEWENGLASTIRVIEDDEDSILNSYPLENIK